LNGTESNDVSSLKISGVSLPAGGKKYSRISMSVESEGTLTRSIENYKLNDTVPIKPYRTYLLTVRVYSGNVMTYSNEFCSTSRTFKSKIGVSNYTVPLCSEPEIKSSKFNDTNAGASEDEDENGESENNLMKEVLETPASPGE
jgi:hypothetical protein